MNHKETNENENPGPDAAQHITAEISKISQLLSSEDDHDAALRSLAIILDDEAAKEDIRRCRGTVALRILDLFETILPKLNSNPLRKRLLRLSSRLAEASQKMPSNSFLQNIICEPHARSGGGYGDVHKATYRNMIVAVKSFRIQLDHRSNWPALDGKICREALTWKHLDHPALLPFLGVCCIHPEYGFKSIVSPWCERGNISHYLRAGNRLPNVEKSLDQLASGIRYLHSENVIHGDLTGNNILLTDDYDLRICDFGLVKWSDTSLVTGGSRAAGTYRYMAPELLGSDDPELARPSFASDVFAFAGLALEMYTGKVPFFQWQDLAVPIKVLRNERPARPDSPVIPDHFWDLMQCCWSEEPTARPSMEDVVISMLRYRSSRPDAFHSDSLVAPTLSEDGGWEHLFAEFKPEPFTYETRTFMPAQSGTMVSTEVLRLGQRDVDEAADLPAAKLILLRPPLVQTASNGLSLQQYSAPSLTPLSQQRPRAPLPSAATSRSPSKSLASKESVHGSTFIAREEDTSVLRPPFEKVYRWLEDCSAEQDLDKPVTEMTAPPTLVPTEKPPIRKKQSLQLIIPEPKWYIDRTSRADGHTPIQRNRSAILLPLGSRVEEVDTRVDGDRHTPIQRQRSPMLLPLGSRVEEVDTRVDGDGHTPIQRERSTKLWGSRVEEVDTRADGDGHTPIQRERSTKLWGSRVEEVDTRTDGDGHTPIQRKRSPQLYGSQVEELVTSHLHSTRERRTFKWVRGELIGQGMYGRVYFALDATTGEMIAVRQVKIPRTPSDKNDSRQVAVVRALKLEIEALKVLDHPNIIKYLGFEETPTNLNMFLEYVPGGSIGSCLLKHGRFDEDVTKSFTSQILAGLEYLHSRGILHRDLESDNILVEMSGFCKISNLGMSKRTEDQTNGYNVETDIWSAGTVVLEMWTGEQFSGGDKVLVGTMFTPSQSRQPPPVPDGLVLTLLAEDFRRKCFATIPEDCPSATQLRRHPYLRLSPGWVFDGFAARSPAHASAL